MLLIKFRVTEFRSVQDSGWIDAEQITALIGTNESGKTNLMLPLWKLNPAAEGQIDLQDDLPRDKYHIYRNASPKPIFIRALYALNAEEQSEIAEMIECETAEVSEVIVSRDFDGNYTYKFPNEPENENENEDDVFVAVDGVAEYIDSHMPKYVYYSNYGNLDSQIFLPQVLQNMNNTDLGVKETAKARTLKTLFKYVNLDPKEITEMGTVPLMLLKSMPLPKRKRRGKFFFRQRLQNLLNRLMSGGNKETTPLISRQTVIIFEFGFLTLFVQNLLNWRLAAQDYSGSSAFILYFWLKVNYTTGMLSFCWTSPD